LHVYNLKNNKMKVKHHIILLYFFLFRNKEYKKLIKLLNMGYNLKHAIIKIENEKLNRIDELTIKTIDRLSELADSFKILIKDSNNGKI